VPHNEDGTKNYHREKNRVGKDKRKTENDVMGLDDDGGLEQVEGGSPT